MIYLAFLLAGTVTGVLSSESAAVKQETVEGSPPDVSPQAHVGSLQLEHLKGDVVCIYNFSSW